MNMQDIRKIKEEIAALITARLEEWEWAQAKGKTRQEKLVIITRLCEAIREFWRERWGEVPETLEKVLQRVCATAKRVCIFQPPFATSGLLEPSIYQTIKELLSVKDACNAAIELLRREIDRLLDEMLEP